MQQASRMMVLAGLIAVAAGLFAGSAVRDSIASTASKGPTVALGAPSLKDGEVLVPVETSGLSFTPYMAMNVHVRWLPGVFRFSAVDMNGGYFDSGRGNCATSIQDDADGGGVVIGCTLLGENSSVSKSGLNLTIALIPVVAGCSLLHLTSYGPPDGGDAITGTYTLENADTFQVNQYRDDAVDTRGQRCQPAAESHVQPIDPEFATAVAALTATASAPVKGTPVPGGVISSIGRSSSGGSSGGQTKAIVAGISGALLVIAAATFVYLRNVRRRGT